MWRVLQRAPVFPDWPRFIEILKTPCTSNVSKLAESVSLLLGRNCNLSLGKQWLCLGFGCGSVFFVLEYEFPLLVLWFSIIKPCRVDLQVIFIQRIHGGRHSTEQNIHGQWPSLPFGGGVFINNFSVLTISGINWYIQVPLSVSYIYFLPIFWYLRKQDLAKAEVKVYCLRFLLCSRGSCKLLYPIWHKFI